MIRPPETGTAAAERRKKSQKQPENTLALTKPACDKLRSQNGQRITNDASSSANRVKIQRYRLCVMSICGRLGVSICGRVGMFARLPKAKKSRSTGPWAQEATVANRRL